MTGSFHAVMVAVDGRIAMRDWIAGRLEEGEVVWAGRQAVLDRKSAPFTPVKQDRIFLFCCLPGRRIDDIVNTYGSSEVYEIGNHIWFNR